MGQIIKQTFRLYNTVGLIDKGKNIYYVPHQDVLFAEKTTLLTKVSEVYYKLFNTVCPFSSAYNNVEISQWSPEDRALKIEGLIDDFRQSRGLGLALNYIIIHREIYNVVNEVETLASSYYYAMFIDSVKQAGSCSVMLNLTPDYFTNFFYLNNGETLTETYDPFNDSMVNCYVERQHYDRFINSFARREESVSFSTTSPALNYGMAVGVEFLFDVGSINVTVADDFTDTAVFGTDGVRIRKRDKYTNAIIEEYVGDRLYPIVSEIDGVEKWVGIRLNDAPFSTVVTIRTYSASNPPDYYYTIRRDNSISITQTIVGESELQKHMTKKYFYTKHLSYTNLERILSTEQSFNYKYQYKKYYDILPIGINIEYDNFRDLCLNLKSINTKNNFITYVNSLSDTERKVIGILFSSFLNVITKENIIFPVKLVDETLPLLTDTIGYYAGGSQYNDIHSPLQHLVIPFISIPRDFQNINKSWLTNNISIMYRDSTFNMGNLSSFDSSTEILRYLNNIGGSQYLLTNFVSKYSPIFNDVDSVSVIDNHLSINYVIRVEQSKASWSSGYTDVPIIELNRNSFGFLPMTKDDTTLGGAEGTIILGEERYYGFEPSGSSDEVIHDSLFYYRSNGVIEKPSGIYFVTRAVTSGTSHYYFRPTTNLIKYFVFVLGNNYFNKQELLLSDRLNNIDLDNDFIDPLLESDPYCFYSISVYETEQILSKMRLFRSYDNFNFRVDLECITAYNDAYKVGLIPSYKIDGTYKRYYTDSIVLTLNSQIPVIEESWNTYYAINKAQMKSQYAIQENNFKSAMVQQENMAGANIVSGFLSGGLKAGTVGAVVGGVGQGLKAGATIYNTKVQNEYAIANISLTQQAKMADMGAKPDTVKLAGSDVLYDALQNDRGFHINYYRIDDVSYNSACKYLERFGYQVNIFDSLNVYDRVGLNFIQLNSFDFIEDNYVLSVEQTDAIREIFSAGVTLLHDKDYLHYLGESGYHNIEKALED